MCRHSGEPIRDTLPERVAARRARTQIPFRSGFACPFVHQHD